MESQSYGQRWSKLQFGIKIIAIVTLFVAVLSLFIETLPQLLCNSIEPTVQQFQIWRLLTSSLITSKGGFLIIDLPLSLYMLMLSMDDVERRYSTVYVLFECIVQMFISNVVLIVFGYPLIVFQVLPPLLFNGFGLSPIIFNFLWQSYALNPTKQITLCGIPYPFSAIYLPWIYLMISFLVGLPYASNIIYCLLGWYQHCYRNRSLLALPYSFYKRIERMVPNLIRNMGGYMRIEDTKAQLKTICAVGCCDINWRRSLEESSTQLPQKTSKLGPTKASYKNHWANKQSENEGIQKQTENVPSGHTKKQGHYELNEEIQDEK